jgi:hypothetical protein
MFVPNAFLLSDSWVSCPVFALFAHPYIASTCCVSYQLYSPLSIRLAVTTCRSLELDGILLARAHAAQGSLHDHQRHDLVKSILQAVSMFPEDGSNRLTAAAIVVSSALVS